MSDEAYRLTAWGSFVARHTADTPLDFWRKLQKEVERKADADMDWAVGVQERIDGLREFMEKRERYGAVENWPRP